MVTLEKLQSKSVRVQARYCLVILNTKRPFSFIHWNNGQGLYEAVCNNQFVEATKAGGLILDKAFGCVTVTNAIHALKFGLSPERGNDSYLQQYTKPW